MKQINAKLKKGERLDDLHRSGYMIIQDPNKFCFGIDAVLLSGFAKVRINEMVLDMGTGTGVIPILLEAKTEGRKFVGIDIQEESVDMARRSVELNELGDRIFIQRVDIKKVTETYKCGSFDVVTCNPPYMNAGGGMVSEHSSFAIARHELLCNLEDVVCAASKMLRFGGRFYMVHRPNRLVDIFYLGRKHNLEPKVMRMVHPYAEKEPNMVLIEFAKGGKPLLKVEPPLIVYLNNSEYTKELLDIYYN